MLSTKKANLSGNSSTNAEEEIAKIPRNGVGQNSERIVGAATSQFFQPCKEEHVYNGERGLQSLKKRLMFQP